MTRPVRRRMRTKTPPLYHRHYQHHLWREHQARSKGARQSLQRKQPPPDAYPTQTIQLRDAWPQALRPAAPAAGGTPPSNPGGGGPAQPPGLPASQLPLAPSGSGGDGGGSMEERHAYENEYLYCKRCPIAESCDAVEAVLRIEFLERIPDFLIEKTTIAGCTSSSATLVLR